MIYFYFFNEGTLQTWIYMYILETIMGQSLDKVYQSLGLNMYM